MNTVSPDAPAESIPQAAPALAAAGMTSTAEAVASVARNARRLGWLDVPMAPQRRSPRSRGASSNRLRAGEHGGKLATGRVDREPGR